MRHFESTAERLDRTQECLQYQRDRLAEVPAESDIAKAIQRKIERLEDEKLLLTGQKTPKARSSRPLRPPRADGSDAPIEVPIEHEEPTDLPVTPR